MSKQKRANAIALPPIEWDPASLARLVLDSFRAGDVEKWCVENKIAPEELAFLRSAFISAGTERLVQLRSRPRWTQINIILDAEASQFERLMTSSLQDVVREWLSADSARAFFFVNKHPGIRLRVLAPAASEITEITGLLDRLASEAAITSWSFGSYDPEVFQFGGEAGLALAHKYFCVESIAVMQFHRARINGRSKMRPEQFSILMTDLLVRSAVEDEMEVWDLWCKMELTGRLDRSAIRLYSAETSDGRRMRDQLRQVYFGLQRIADPEAAFFQDYRSRLPQIAQALKQLEQSGELLWGARRILPFWIIFHWNRMRFDLERQRQLSRYMVRLYSPKASYAGGSDG